ncbi:NF038105 family protein [Acinetobacter larvae]|uniref:NF038105 family protein n=1 Tax=Acinetobacter larvae TaxID=1789224 RepID=A0A1B2LXK7_9GAMM|nr:NF038105 family protein [Acinetobacter larvae]AOA57660.1 hypothetical protein BFG52_04335 [Acinetobacter larvae]
MTIKKFEPMPSANEEIDMRDIDEEHIKAAWKDYEAKPEYKKFNKHDLIESLQAPASEDGVSEQTQKS